MNYAETIAQRMVTQAKTYWPMNGNDIAKYFESHGKCSYMSSFDGGEIGVLERSDDHVLALWLCFDEEDEELVTAWRYTVHGPGRLFEHPTAGGGITGDWETIAYDIAQTVTEWLDASQVPDSRTIEGDVRELCKKLDKALYWVGSEFEEDGSPNVTVSWGEDATAFVCIDYFHNWYRVEYTDWYGDYEVKPYANFDALVAGLLEHGAKPRT